METLRGPQGCSWDKEQTAESILKDHTEELFEFIEAVEKGDTVGMREELGDLLLHVVFQAQIAKEAGNFELDQVIEKLNKKHGKKN